MESLSPVSRPPPGYSKANIGITHTESLFAGYPHRNIRDLTSGSGPFCLLGSVRRVRPKFLLWREFAKRNQNGKSHSYWSGSAVPFPPGLPIPVPVAHSASPLLRRGPGTPPAERSVKGYGDENGVFPLDTSDLREPIPRPSPNLCHYSYVISGINRESVTSSSNQKTSRSVHIITLLIQYSLFFSYFLRAFWLPVRFFTLHTQTCFSFNLHLIRSSLLVKALLKFSFF